MLCAGIDTLYDLESPASYKDDMLYIFVIGLSQMGGAEGGLPY